MLKKGLKDLLQNDGPTAAIVGAHGVRTGRIPQGASYPVLVIKYVASEYIKTLGGVNKTQMRRLQIDVWANTPKEADNLAKVLHDKLDGFTGVLSEGTFVGSCLPCGDVDLLDEELQLAGLAVDFNVWFNSPVSLSPLTY